MKNFSIRLILLVLLVVAGPTIQKMVVESQQKGHINVPVSDAEQSSFEEENIESDGQIICPFLNSIEHFKLQLPFNFQAALLFVSLTDNIVLPPPKLK